MTILLKPAQMGSGSLLMH